MSTRTPVRGQLRELIASRYDVDGFVGVGAMGAVLKAFDPKLRRNVAIKCLHDHFFQMDEAVEVFLHEAHALANLSHPHLVPIYGVLQTDDGVAMVQEFIEGETLEQALRERGRIPQRELTPILAQLASVIGYLHSLDFLHRDLKPENVLVDSAGFVRLIDFGLASRFDAPASSERAVGTPAYMAPEQIRREALSPATDLYQLGVTAFELLTGALPFEEGGDVEAIRQAHLSRRPPRIEAFDRRVDPLLSLLVDDCLRKDPGDRLATCKRLVRRLEPIYEALHGESLEDAGLIYPFEDVGQGPESKRIALAPSPDDAPIVEAEEVAAPAPTRRASRLAPALVAALILVAIAAMYALTTS